eukprot:TRINITY_DN12148_c0_g1_i1.p2 TRINITY_DN12148_c0_g1~~TRINITY_DN12148_c0_g1_i1.p2  ORF type:complete len:293 (+),score=24.30 TRINITY_DN12148_c0_g1_i1:2306-3184(+)
MDGGIQSEDLRHDRYLAKRASTTISAAGRELFQCYQLIRSQAILLRVLMHAMWMIERLTRVALYCLLFLISISHPVKLTIASFNNTHSLQVACHGDAILVHMNFEPWCICAPNIPYCTGSECAFAWAKLDSPSVAKFDSISRDFEPYAAANVTEATDRNWALFDGFSPECDDCKCYESHQPIEPTLKAAIRRYQVLHSHIRYGLRSRRIIMNRGGVGGGWGDKLRGTLHCLLFGFQHDLAFFLAIDDPIPLDHVFTPTLFDWRYTPGIPGKPPGREKAMFKRPCLRELGVLT